MPGPPKRSSASGGTKNTQKNTGYPTQYYGKIRKGLQDVTRPHLGDSPRESYHPSAVSGDVVFAVETFDFLEQVDACETRADVARVLHEAIGKIGFYTVMMCWLERDQSQDGAQIQVIGPHKDFAGQYVKRHYFRYSPVVRQMRQTRIPFRRSEVTYDSVTDPMAHRIMLEAQDVGLEDAWVVPIHSKTGLAGFVAADNERKSVAQDKLRQFHVMCLWAHSRARHLPGGDK
jgi:hypothetical protein